MRIGVIGLGQMGARIARNLIQAGFEVKLFNRSFRKEAEELVAAGATLADSPCLAAKDADVVITLLSDDVAIRQVVIGTEGSPGVLQGLRSGAIHLAMSTFSPELAADLAARHRELEQEFICAPVFGCPSLAEARRIWLAVAGECEAISRCQPLFEAISRGWTVIGLEPQDACVAKLAGNFLLASMIESMGEALALITKSGVDRGSVLNVIDAVFQSPLYQSYGAQIVSGSRDPSGFKLSLGLKDLRLALAWADEMQVPMPVASVIRDQMLSGIDLGVGVQDWSVLARLASQRAGLNRAAGHEL